MHVSNSQIITLDQRGERMKNVNDLNFPNDTQFHTTLTSFNFGPWLTSITQSTIMRKQE